MYIHIWVSTAVRKYKDIQNFEQSRGTYRVVHSQSNYLSQKGPRKSRPNSQVELATKCRLVQTLSYYTTSKLVVFEFELRVSTRVGVNLQFERGREPK